MEKTLIILKPDAVQRRLAGKILSGLKKKGIPNNRVEDDANLGINRKETLRRARRQGFF